LTVSGNEESIAGLAISAFHIHLGVAFAPPFLFAKGPRPGRGGPGGGIKGRPSFEGEPARKTKAPGPPSLADEVIGI